jgi:glycine cleavage system H protein
VGGFGGASIGWVALAARLLFPPAPSSIMLAVPPQRTSPVANVPDDLRYTAEHEWARRTGEAGVIEVGITDYAQGELGDIVFINLPKVGDRLEAHQAFGTIEAVKAVSDLYAPLAGEVVAINPGLDADPALVNRAPYADGWMIRLRIDPAQFDTLLSADAYRDKIGA